MNQKKHPGLHTLGRGDRGQDRDEETQWGMYGGTGIIWQGGGVMTRVLWGGWLPGKVIRCATSVDPVRWKIGQHQKRTTTRKPKHTKTVTQSQTLTVPTLNGQLLAAYQACLDTICRNVLARKGPQQEVCSPKSGPLGRKPPSQLDTDTCYPIDRYPGIIGM